MYTLNYEKLDGTKITVTKKSVTSIMLHLSDVFDDVLCYEIVIDSEYSCETIMCGAFPERRNNCG